jgi:acetolactate synthase-1/3 small subunit
VLARVIGLFAGRGYNIESLTVAEVDRAAHLSRITVVTSGTPAVIEQIRAQLGRLVPVHRVVDVTVEKVGIERELALIKVASTGEKRVESLRVSQVFRARALDTTHGSFVFEITGTPAKIDAFVELMRPLGLVEAAARVWPPSRARCPCWRWTIRAAGRRTGRAPPHYICRRRRRHPITIMILN